MRFRCASRGFSLVETIVVTAMLVMLMTAVTTAIVTFYRTNAYTLAQTYEVIHARRGMELAVRDLREMTYAEDGAYPLVTIGTSTVAFYSDIDRDNSVEYVRYFLATTTLYKYVYNATGSPPVYNVNPDERYTVSEYVQNGQQGTTTFRYFLEGGSEAPATSTVTDIRYVELNVIINVDPVKNPGQYSIRTGAAPRNLKTTF